MGDEVSDAFDAFDRRWAERQGVFERRTIRRELELVVMPGEDARALEVARRRAFRSRRGPRSEGGATIRAVRTARTLAASRISAMFSHSPSCCRIARASGRPR
jgi:hypothetical protein